MTPRGLTPIPDDAALAGHFQELISDDAQYRDIVLHELGETIETVTGSGLPKEFAYGNLINFFRDMDESDLVSLAASAYWTLYGHNTPDITLLETDTDGDAQNREP